MPLWLRRCRAMIPALPGRLAQLGERRLDKAEVTGSSPVSPITKPLLSGAFVVPGLNSGAQLSRCGMTDEPLRLPNAQQARVPTDKLVRYALDPSHERGRHKARVFVSALGITAGTGAICTTRSCERSLKPPFD